MPQDNPYLANPRWAVAERVAETARRRFPADVLAIGAYGRLAHGDDDETTGIDLVVVTYRESGGPRPTRRRIDGVLVKLDVVDADRCLRRARTLDTSWPLAADRYVTTRPLYDPTGWLDQLRDAHLGRLAQARAPEFSTLAREAWCEAASAHALAGRLAAWYDTDGALVGLGVARLAAANVVGLLTRTYFRDGADAVRRAGLAGADLTELGEVLRAQAGELAARGRPVDGTVADLFDA
ncbi:MULTISPECIES: nucleotidyltransferase domain-containing protein [Polymorphospora]|uniref:Nucleotidyltransferase domain-containing protein n=1 Tax=Polymorphospora lycopeni TaxID=3140240 RepID=A0ABV5CQJ3_9ACTN